VLSRRAVIMGGLAASASLRPIALAQNPPAGGPDVNTPPRTLLQLQRRNIVVNGKPASASRFAFVLKTKSTSRA